MYRGSGSSVPPSQPLTGQVLTTGGGGGGGGDVNITEVGGAAISLGQKTSANSFPVVIASDQSAVHVIADTGSTTAVTGTITTAETVPTTIFNGKTAVTTAGTRVTLAASQAVKSVTVKALAANTGTIYVGNSSVSSTNGFALAAGDSISMDLANLNTVNLDCSVNGEGVTYFAVA